MELDPLSARQIGVRAFPEDSSSSASGADPDDSSSVASSGPASAARSPTAQRSEVQEASTNLTLGPTFFGLSIGASHENDADTAAAAAERHRLANSVGLDLPALASWVEKAVPFVLLLLVTFIYRHIHGIAIFLWLNMILAKADDLARKQAALKQDRSRRRCLGLAAVMLMHIGLVLLVLRREQLWTNFLLIGTAAVPTAWDVFFRVSVADVLVRFWGIALKSGVLVMHKAGSRHELRKRSQVLTVLEHALVFYRNLLATPVWYSYFTDSKMRGMLANSCALLYMVLKISLVWERGQQLVISAKAVAQAQATFGKSVTPAELCEVGAQCSICQETLQSPVKLTCNHIYCDGCISEWFERERTCPMCRAVVQPPGINAHSDGSTPLLPCLF